MNFDVSSRSKYGINSPYLSTLVQSENNFHFLYNIFAANCIRLSDKQKQPKLIFNFVGLQKQSCHFVF